MPSRPRTWGGCPQSPRGPQSRGETFLGLKLHRDTDREPTLSAPADSPRLFDHRCHKLPRFFRGEISEASALPPGSASTSANSIRQNICAICGFSLSTGARSIARTPSISVNHWVDKREMHPSGTLQRTTHETHYESLFLASSVFSFSARFWM